MTFRFPETFVERQIKNRVEQRLMAMAEQGIDPRITENWTGTR